MGNRGPPVISRNGGPTLTVSSANEPERSNAQEIPGPTTPSHCERVRLEKVVTKNGDQEQKQEAVSAAN